MSDHSAIEWCDATWQVLSGCSPVSEGCRLCYSARLAGTRLKHRPQTKGLTNKTADGRFVFNGKVRFNDELINWPLTWSGAPAARREGRNSRVFVADRSDPFHEMVSRATLARMFARMALATWIDFIVLTKRSARMREIMPTLEPNGPEPNIRTAIADIARETPALCARVAKRWNGRSPFDFGVTWPLPNVWLGVSVENQDAADERIPDLLQTPAAKRCLSCEPLLGPIAWAPIWDRKLHWIIVGGESGHGARPMHPDWARALRDQCAAAAVPFFFKQWGAWAIGPLAKDGACVVVDERMLVNDPGLNPQWMVRVNKKVAGRLLDGVEHSAFPT